MYKIRLFRKSTKSRRSSQTTRVDGPFLITRFWAKLRELSVSVLWSSVGSPLLLPDQVQGSYRAQEGPRGCGILQTLKKLPSVLSECRPAPPTLPFPFPLSPCFVAGQRPLACGEKAPWPRRGLRAAPSTWTSQSTGALVLGGHSCPLPWKGSRCPDCGLSRARTGGGGPWPPCSLCGSFLWRTALGVTEWGGCCCHLGGDGWERRVPSRLSGPGVAAAAVSGPMALSGLKLRGKDIGKPIEKGPRAK